MSPLALRAANQDVPLRTPHNVEAEQALLGILMYETEAVFAASDVQPEHFFEPLHGRLFEAIRAAARKGRGTAPVLIGSLFEADDAFHDLGGLVYLGDLVSHAPPPANIRDYAAVVVGNHARRELMRVSSEIAAMAADPARAAMDVLELTAEAERLVSAVAEGAGTDDAFAPAGEVVRVAIDHAQARSGRIEYPTGIQALDDMLGGLNPGEATILAARPGTGKTVGAQTVAKANAQAGRGTCFFSLEMAADPLGMRLATDVAYNRRAVMFSGVSSNPTAHRAQRNDLTDDQWVRLREAQEIVADWPILIDTRPGLSLAQIEAASRRAFRKWARRGIAPGPIIIDHLGKVRPPHDRRGNATAEMGDLSAGVAEMAKRLHVPVLALVQLNRDVENREDKRPVLRDLRQSGQLEEDARQVIFLFRPEHYYREAPPGETVEAGATRLENLRKVEHQLFWIVQKNSHGPCGQVKSFCDIACSAIRDWDA